jgi:uncharacterized protein YdhG (YjbR/CyaY superfamily)
MQSTAATVDAYIAEAPHERQEALRRLRDLCRAHLPGYTEAMQYGMPGYSRNGAVEVGFASQKNYIALYLLKQEVLDAHRHELAGIILGKGCIRYSRPAKIDFDLVQRMLEETCASPAPIC